jgi:hypothetical protein
VGLKLNGTLQLLDFAGEVNLLEDNVATLKKNTELNPWHESMSELPTKQLPLVGEFSGNFCGLTMPHGQRDGSLQPYSWLFRPEPLLFLCK